MNPGNLPPHLSIVYRCVYRAALQKRPQPHVQADRNYANETAMRAVKSFDNYIQSLQQGEEPDPADWWKSTSE